MKILNPTNPIMIPYIHLDEDFRVGERVIARNHSDLMGLPLADKINTIKTRLGLFPVSDDKTLAENYDILKSSFPELKPKIITRDDSEVLIWGKYSSAKAGNNCLDIDVPDLFVITHMGPAPTNDGFGYAENDKGESVKWERDEFASPAYLSGLKKAYINSYNEELCGGTFSYGAPEMIATYTRDRRMPASYFHDTDGFMIPLDGGEVMIVDGESLSNGSTETFEGALNKANEMEASRILQRILGSTARIVELQGG